MRPVKLLAEYCGDGNPVILQEFYPGRGWVRFGWRKRASASWLRKLREEGATYVCIETAPNGLYAADFSITELLRAGGPA